MTFILVSKSWKNAQFFCKCSYILQGSCFYIILLVPKNKDCTHFFWNMTRGSASKSDISISFPFWITMGCFLLISQPTCEKKKPLLALWGSASVSVYLWCCRWSLTHMYMQFCPAPVCKINSMSLSAKVALKHLCVYSLCAPIVTLAPKINAKKKAEKN